MEKRIKKKFAALSNGSEKSSVPNQLPKSGRNDYFHNNFHITDIANNDYELTIKESLIILYRQSNKENNDAELSLY